ncbi:hypothetical protein ABIB25_003997 [Nakamurella sp. UYEF19]|uniref:VWA domain-containing protein n=1 Tax=Nakamurella sp. UYEF19 TaxID=1756392 RepID=UPI003392C6C3
MGRHADAGGRRRVAAWPIVVAVVVLLVAALTVGYFVVLDRNKDVAACTGNTVLEVTASPGAGRAATDAAAAFNATKPVARSTCVSVVVSVTDGAVAASALAAGWKNQPTPAPALWVVDSASDVAAVDASNSAMTAGHTNSSLAISPVVLAVRAAPTGAAPTWSSLATGSGTALVLAMPDPVTNRASNYALESLVAASTANPDDKPLDAAAVTGASSLLARLASSTPAPPDKTAVALTALAAGQATFDAVPVVESDLASFNTANPPGLAAVYPAGPTAHDEIMAIQLTAPWVSDAMSDAAAAFDAYLGDPAGIAILTKDDLRTSATPATAPGVDLRSTVTALPEAKTEVRTALHAAWATARGSSPTASSPPPASSAPVPSSPVSSTPVSSPPASSAPVPSAPASSATTATGPTGSTTSAPTSPTTKSTPPTSAGTAPTKASSAPTTRTTPTTPTTPAAPTTPVITLVLDTSGSMDTVEGGQQRITWMREATTAALAKNPLDFFGLWSFSTQDGAAGYQKLVPTGALTDQIGGGTRAAVINTSVTGLFPGGNSWTYGTIQAAYTDAVNSAVAGRPNKVIVVTDGADTTPGLTRSALKSTIAALAGQNKNVGLYIIGLSGDVNEAAMTEIAQAGGGNYTSLGSLADLAPALQTLTSTG